METNKKELRKYAIGQVKGLNKGERAEYEVQITKNLIGMKEWKNAKVIAITISQPHEIDTKPIIEEAWKEGKAVAVPKCIPKGKAMEFYQISSYDQLESVYFNLLEPMIDVTQPVAQRDIDLIVVPGLLFDQQGYRIGHGGGYYDRYLIDFPNTTVALAFDEQMVNQIPYEAFDIPVQHMITQSGVHSE